MGFDNKPFRSKREQAEFNKSFMGYYSRLVKKNSFLYMGLPMMLSLGIACELLTNFTSLRYERRDKQVKELDENDALKLATQKRRKPGSINDEYYRLQGLMEDSQNYEPKRVKRLPGESENVWVIENIHLIMVSFSCEVCGETVPKKKCEKHFRRCPDAYFTCLDCQKTFYGNDYIKHTSCISEAEKYQKGLYRGKKNKKKTKQIKVQQDKKKSEAPKGTGKDNTTFSVAKYLKKNHKKSLYQVFKDVKKNDKSIKDKKQFLKLLKVNLDDNGILTISL